MKKGYFDLSPKLLVQALGMPANTEVLGAEWVFSQNSIRIYFSHPDIQEVREGCAIRQYFPTQETKWRWE